MEFTAAVITMSDKGARGERVDTSGPAICALLEESGYKVVFTKLIPDDYTEIAETLKYCADELDVFLCCTTGGTGFAPRDVTPEATISVVEKLTPGIPEAMRAESMKITPNGCLSREVAGIRGRTLIVNLPGSKKASTENLSAVLKPMKHGIEVLRELSHDCGEHHHHHHE